LSRDVGDECSMLDNNWYDVEPDENSQGIYWYSAKRTLRLPPTLEEIRHRLIAYLSSVAEDEKSIASLLSVSLEKLINIVAPRNVPNLAPFGIGRLTGLRTRTVSRQVETSRTVDDKGLVSVVYDFEDGVAKYERVQITEPSGTGHILDEVGETLCHLRATIEFVDPKDRLKQICSACQKERQKKPWPDWVYPTDDPTGGTLTKLINLAEYRARAVDK